MAGIDTSIYANQPKPLDPFSMPNQLLALQGAQMRNRLLGQEIQSNQALGQAYQSTIDPSTGQIDPSKLPAAIAGSGATYGLPEAYQSAVDYQRKATDLSTAQSQSSDAALGNYSTRVKTLDGALYPMLNDKNLTYAKVVGQAHSVFASNPSMQPGDLAGFFSTLPRGPDGGPPTSDQLRTAITQFHTRSLSPSDATTYQNPHVATVNTGNAVNFVDTNPVTNPKLAGSSVALNPPPDTTDGPNIGGQPTRITKQQQYDVANGKAVMASDGSIAYPPSGGSVVRTAGGATVLTDAQGRSIDPITKQPATVAPSAPAAPATPPVGHAVPVGAPLGSDADAAQQVTQANAFQTAANGSADRKAMLNNLQADLQNFTSGPGSNWKNVAEAWANRNVIPSAFGGAFRFNPQEIASQEAFNKQATQLAQQQFATLGGTGTDAQLGSASHSNPNSDLSKLGNQQIINLLKGNEDAITAKNQAWQAYKQQNGPGSYGQFSSKFSSVFDPRVFQSAYQSPADFKSMMRTMSPGEQKTFAQKLALARTSVDQGGFGASGPGSLYNGQ